MKINIEKNGTFNVSELNHFIATEVNLAEQFITNVKSDDIIVFWGAGKALYWYDKFFKMNGVTPAFVVDKNNKLHGQELYGYTIVSIEHILKISKDRLKIVITTPKNKEEVAKEICQLLGEVKVYSFEAEIYYTFLHDIKQYREYLLNNMNLFYSLYQDLRDDKSRDTLIAFIKGRISGNQRYFAEVMESDQYFPADIIELNKHEVIVEAGSNDGSTLKEMIKITKGKFEKIYCFEPDLMCIHLLEDIIKETGKPISLIKKGVGAKNGEVKFKADSLSGGSKVVENDEYDYKIEITTIDEEIKQSVTMIKMDIEGLELEALKGCKRILSEDVPKLAICVYHNMQDIIDIWQFLKNTQPQYTFYLRHHNWGGGRDGIICNRG